MSAAETFDYVIVGAGTAGCVLANRLTEDGRATVGLLEAGPPDKSFLIHVPAGFIRMLFHPVYNYMFFTPEQPNQKNRKIYIPRGRGLGGSSSINGMIYIRGHRRDYDDWAALGNAGWGYDDVLPYFRKSEHNEDFADGVHGTSGELNVKYLAAPNPLNRVFLEAAAQIQRPRIPDFNTGDNEGFGIFQVTVKDGRRQSAATAFLNPAKPRPNLAVMTGAEVQRVAVEDGRAAAVELRADGQLRRIAARREVILAAGSLASPQLLMLSGIGDGAELSRHGIAVVRELKGVGKNLQDHISCPVHFLSPRITSYGVSARAMPKIAWNVVLYAIARKGFLGNNIVESGGFVKTVPGLDRPDIQHIFAPTHQGKPGRLLAWGHGYRITTVLLHPKSRGRVGIASARAGDAPVIEPNFFSDPAGSDMANLIRGIKDARRILMAPAFDPYRGPAVWPAENVQSDAELEDFVRGYSSTVFHPVGTCKMGRDDMAVVDDKLRVRGVAALRVADASVMPTITGGNTNAPVMMIAEKAADMIRAA